MKRLDFLIIAVVVLLSLAALIPALNRKGDIVRIEQDGKIIYEGGIHEDAIIEASGNTITISGGRVSITAADCPDGLCMSGECTSLHPLICVPNKLSVTIVSSKEGLDGISS
ncbi:MAG: NusG domain II-containing protein [Clostridia bacterium]|nr:NusG domain II-containing protein [Clostridia bacterium]